MVEHAAFAHHRSGELLLDYGLPPAAMRYTEAKLSPIAAEMLDDIELDTVDFQPSYDEKHSEPRVLPGPLRTCSSMDRVVSPSAWRRVFLLTTLAKFVTPPSP